MSDDAPPPRKRSRFFSDGKIRVGNTIEKIRKLASGQQVEPQGNSQLIIDTDSASLPPSREHKEPVILRSRFPDKHSQRSDSTFGKHAATSNTSTHSSTPGGGSAVFSDSGHTSRYEVARFGNHEPQNTSSLLDQDDSQTSADQDTKLSRRRGVYGAQDLISRNLGTTGQNHNLPFLRQLPDASSQKISQGTQSFRSASNESSSSISSRPSGAFLFSSASTQSLDSPSWTNSSQISNRQQAAPAAHLPSPKSLKRRVEVLRPLPTLSGPEGQRSTSQPQASTSCSQQQRRSVSQPQHATRHPAARQQPTAVAQQERIDLAVSDRQSYEAPAVQSMPSFIQPQIKRSQLPQGVIGFPVSPFIARATSRSEDPWPDQNDARVFVAANKPVTPRRNDDGDVLSLSCKTPGRELPTIPPRLPHHVTSLPLHATLHPLRAKTAKDEASVPDNALTAPHRIPNAFKSGRLTLKRKRGYPVLPPPSYIHHHTGDPNFNVFQNGFLMYPEMCILLTSHMSIDSLVSLYAISKDFHTIVDTRLTTVVLGQARRKAHESQHAFPFRCYAHLCRVDPGLRFLHPNPQLAAQGLMRMVPSFRWLKFIVHREKVVQEVFSLFAENGCPLPERCSMTMKRMWFIFDIPDNARRIGYIHCPTLFTDQDLFFGMCFIVKLDMLCNDPVGNEKTDTLRKLLMSSMDGFDGILKVIKRERWAGHSDLIRAFVRYGFPIPNVPPEHHASVSDVFGIPLDEVGRLKKEGWGFRRTAANQRVDLLLRPDQLMPREMVRRGLRFKGHYLRALMHGYMNPDSFDPVPPRTYGRRIKHLEADEYDIDDVVGGAQALALDDGGDDLLDLGDTNPGSTICIERATPSDKVVRYRTEHEELRKLFINAWKQEAGIKR